MNYDLLHGFQHNCPCLSGNIFATFKNIFLFYCNQPHHCGYTLFSPILVRHPLVMPWSPDAPVPNRLMGKIIENNLLGNNIEVYNRFLQVDDDFLQVFNDN